MKRRRAIYKTENGIRYKLCTGFSHRKGVFVPVNEFSTRERKSGYYSECKTCESNRRGSERLVLAHTYMKYLDAIIKRLGIMETCRRLDRSQNWLFNVRRGRTQHFQRRTARAIILLYTEVVRTGEIRHRDSIKHGAYLRGRQEKHPTRKIHLYVPHGDADTELKRLSHARETEEQRDARNARDRERRRKRRLDKKRDL